jgi:DNA polymerase (family 10)
VPIHNSDIAEIFNQTADVLEIQGANPFRVRAYRNASRVIGNWPTQLSALLRQGKALPKLPGIGKDLTEKIEEISRTGHFDLLDQLRKKTPKPVLELLVLPGIGPKRVRILQETLGIHSLQELKKAAEQGRIHQVPGFGEKIETRILQVLKRQAEAPKRLKLFLAEETLTPLIEYLDHSKNIDQVVAAGSLRRRLETVGDLDLLASARAGSDIMDRFIDYEDVREVLSHGETRSTIVLKSGLQVDLRVVPERSFGAALHYFTGSKAHNIAIRTLGVKRGLKINEYGIFKGTRRVGGRTEEEVFRSVGLPYIEPELRENRGEIEAARKETLPKLVELKNIRGDLHAHTHETDGRLTLEEMANAAEQIGYEYLAITDHSRRLTVARGLTPARLKEQIKKIDRFNERSPKIRILKAIEVDILEDGSLDLPDSVLSMLDLTVCSVHSKFDLSPKKQTDRIIRAMDNPNFRILGHPTGRLIGSREPYGLELERLIQAAKDRGCYLELNAQPERMDLPDTYCRMAKEMGVRFAISTDAHSNHDLRYMKYGVSQARRGWLERRDILNTLPLNELIRALAR